VLGQVIKMCSMKKRFLLLILLLGLKSLVFSQDKIEIYAANYHSNTTASTLNLLAEEDIKLAFLNTMDSVVQKLFGRQLIYANNFHFTGDHYVHNAFNRSYLRKKDLISLNPSTLYLSFDISERPISIEMPINNLDTNYVNELAKKKIFVSMNFMQTFEE